jgi:hypothetical protein
MAGNLGFWVVRMRVIVGLQWARATFSNYQGMNLRRLRLPRREVCCNNYP